MKNFFTFLSRFWFLFTILGIMITVLSFGDYLPLDIKRSAVTASSTIRSVLMFLLPFLVFPFIATSIALLRSNGLILVISLIALIALSNFISIMIGASVASLFIPHLTIQTVFNNANIQSLSPYFELYLEPLLSVETILMCGLVGGFALSVYQNRTIIRFLNIYKDISNLFFKNIFIPILPIYIFGTLLKLDAENDFYTIFSDFGNIILIIVATQLVYITFMFWLGSQFSLKKTVQCWQNCLPAAFLGFSTMSSLVTMPVTLKAAEKNLGDKNIAQIAITTTVNCHDIGECISLTIIALTVYLMGNGMVLPDLFTFIQFAFVLAIAQFSGVSVPGGSAVVIIPLLISYLGFSAEMVGLVTTLSIFMDPIGTCNNVMGNSAFALIIKKYFHMIEKLSKDQRRSKDFGIALESEDLNESEGQYAKASSK